MNIENTTFWAFFQVATVTKWLIQRHLGYRKMVPDDQREKNQEKQRRETVEH